MTSALFILSVFVESIGAVTSATAPFSNAPFFQFLLTDTGFPTILSGNLNDLGFLSLKDSNAPLGVIFWTTVIFVVSLAFITVLIKGLKIGESEIILESPVSVPMQDT